jgi:transcriptional regulator with XRE-family HTH domain
MTNTGDSPTEFAQWFKRQLARRGWRRVDFAERAGIAPSTITRWLNEGRTPDLESIRMVAEVFEINSDDVLNVLDLRGRAVDMASPAVRRLQPKIDRVSWDEAKFQVIESMLDFMLDPRGES